MYSLSFLLWYPVIRLMTMVHLLFFLNICIFVCNLCIEIIDSDNLFIVHIIVFFRSTLREFSIQIEWHYEKMFKYKNTGGKNFEIKLYDNTRSVIMISPTNTINTYIENHYE